MRMDKEIRRQKQRDFLTAYEICGCTTRACDQVGISTRTYKSWLTSSPSFKRRFNHARKMAAEALLAEARRRALQGVPEIQLYKGAPIFTWIDKDGNVCDVKEGHPDPTKRPDPLIHTRVAVTVMRYSDKLLAMLLKAAYPEKFNQRQQHGNDPSTFMTRKEVEERVSKWLEDKRAKGLLPSPN